MTRRIEYLDSLTADHVSVKEAAEVLGISEGSVRGLLQHGELTTIKRGYTWPTWLALTELEARKERMKPRNL